MKLRIKLLLLISIVITLLFSISSSIIIHRSFDFALEQIILQYKREHINFRMFYEKLNMYDIQMEGGTNEPAELSSSAFITSIISSGVYYDNDEKIASSLNTEQERLFLHELISQKDGYIIKSNQYVNYLGVVTQANLEGETVYLITVNDISEIYIQRDEQYRQMILLTLLLITATIITVFLILRKITAPLNVLTKASREIAMGAYNKRTEINSKDEVGLLSDSFDKMAEAVEEKIKSLEQEICTREDFVSNFSHELKTPMTSIMGYADMLRSYGSDPQTQVKAANYIYAESKQLNTLSLKLMELMSLSEGHIEKTPCDVQSFTLTKQDGIVKWQLEPACVISDKLLIEKVLSNLINNAKNAGATEIVVSGKAINHQYMICVSDNGCGITSEEIEKLTEPFYQTDKVRSRQNGGFGLGLALCKKILAAHNTELTIDSIPNKGARIEFKLAMK